MAEQYRNAWQTLEGKVTAVAALHRRCQLAEGAGRYIWMIGVPLLAAVGLEILLRLPLALRAPVVPFFILACAVLGWRYIVRPVREKDRCFGRDAFAAAKDLLNNSSAARSQSADGHVLVK